MRARERDDQAIAHWRKVDWLRIQKKARQQGWSIVVIDESGFMLQPVVRRTWAPKGQTPIQYSWVRHDHLSAISAITLAPHRRRFGIYFQLHYHNIRYHDVMALLRLVYRHLRRKFILVLDRYSVHRKAVRLRKERPLLMPVPQTELTSMTMPDTQRAILEARCFPPPWP